MPHLPTKKHPGLALTPPMGWNSFDVYAELVTEDEVIETAEFMADRLLASGWDTVVMDAGWSMKAGTQGKGYQSEIHAMDPYGRFQPDPERFPSSRSGAGFGPLADRVHRLGLKLGLHALRGVPRLAVEAGLPVLGTSATCADVVDVTSICKWSDRMYGLDCAQPAAQTYADAMYAQFAEWGIDYVKLDDIASPYYTAEVEAACLAIERSGRPMLLSLSPGDTSPTAHVEHLKEHAHIWRISPDFWDRWADLRRNFDLLANWISHSGPGGWADADMLPIGEICLRGYGDELPPRWSWFTPDEQRTLFALWCIARSPLMLGGKLTTLPDETVAMLTHPHLIAMNQQGVLAKEVHRSDPRIVWETWVGEERYEAEFNVSEVVSDSGIPPHGVVVRNSSGVVF